MVPKKELQNDTAIMTLSNTITNSVTLNLVVIPAEKVTLKFSAPFLESNTSIDFKGDDNTILDVKNSIAKISGISSNLMCVFDSY